MMHQTPSLCHNTDPPIRELLFVQSTHRRRRHPHKRLVLADVILLHRAIEEWTEPILLVQMTPN